MKINFNSGYIAANAYAKMNAQKKVSFGGRGSDRTLYNKGYDAGYESGRKACAEEIENLQAQIAQLEAENTQLKAFHECEKLMFDTVIKAQQDAANSLSKALNARSASYVPNV